MADKAPSFMPPSALDSRTQIFPTLTPAQIERARPFGKLRKVNAGEILFEPCDPAISFFIVLSGAMEIVQSDRGKETLIAQHPPAEFTGEINMISWRPSLVRGRVTQPGEFLELTPENLRALVGRDAELSEIFMRAFILRRLALIAGNLSDVILLGSHHSAGTLRLREFLGRNGHPYTYVDLETDSQSQEMLDRFAVKLEEVPVVVCHGSTVLRNPSTQRLAECLGFNAAVDESQVRDLVIVGAGPAGLAAAVYGASEGLDVLVLETNAPGGQAGSSSRIENYLGFPTGITGQELAARAFTQAEKFGAELLIASGKRLWCDRKPNIVEVDNGARIPARAIVIATGAEYRRPQLEDLSRFEGAGIYYGATFVEAQLCTGDEVVVVGGGNSAGQAAVFLAQTASRVHMLVRSAGLAESMSRYLIRRIDETPAIELRTYTEIVALRGDDHLESVTWHDSQTGASEEHAIKHVFVMTGGDPNTRWLDGCVVLDEKGFIKTGPDLSPEDLRAFSWPLAPRPFLLETSVPGVFAVGDVRGGSIKRVASAVGEGSIAISFVHQVLQE